MQRPFLKLFKRPDEEILTTGNQLLINNVRTAFKYQCYNSSFDPAFAYLNNAIRS